MKSLQRLLTISILCLWTTASFSQARVIIPDSLMINGDRDSEILLPQQPQQQIRHRHSAEADSLRKLSRMVTWRIDSRTGERIWASPDTLLHNFQHTTLPDGFSTAIGHLGTLGSPSINKIFFDQREGSHFVFNNVYFPFMRTPDNNLFVNTRVPYTRLTYQRSPFSFGTTAPHQEDRFSGRLSSNFGRTTNVTFDIDLLDARGFYNSQGTRHNNIGFSGNYLTDRLEVHGYMNFGTMGQVENGGLRDAQALRMITHPHEEPRRFTPRDIPVRFDRANTWNRVGNNQFSLSTRYNLGYHIVNVDTLSYDYGSRRFVPVASINFTSHYTQQFRRFLSHDTTSVAQPGTGIMLYPHRISQFYSDRMPFLYSTAPDDSIRFSSFRNVVALNMREGFRDWVQFGLSAFLEHEVRTFSMRDFDNPSLERMTHTEHAVTLGGVLNRQQSEHLLFNIRADMGVLGANLGEFRAMGDIETRFTIAGRTTSLAAEAHVKNLRPKFLQQTLATKYFHWRDNNFGDIRRVRVGGRLHIPFTNTTLSAGVENIQNFIYFDRNRNITQESGNVQVIAARIDQRFRFGIFNWDNHVVYQLSSNDAVIPLPTLALYSNMFVQFRVSNVLTVQAGVDTHFHTRFYAKGYEPALLQFYNQREMQIGGFPISTLYANMHLSRTRFFLMWYNAASRVLRPIESFTVPMYPVNPWGLRVGISTTFHN